MLNVCFHCGMYRADKLIEIEAETAYALCPECHHKHFFLQLPLLIVSGASGTGKSTICQALVGRVNEVVALDADIFWRSEFNQPETKYRDFFETCLRVSKNIAQSGRPVVLFGAGLGVPENLEQCIERRYFSSIHYLALTCQEPTLIERLCARPAWRASDSSSFLAEQVRYNAWLQANALNTTTTSELLDTTSASLEETISLVMVWIRSKIALNP